MSKVGEEADVPTASRAAAAPADGPITEHYAPKATEKAVPVSSTSQAPEPVEHADQSEKEVVTEPRGYFISRKKLFIIAGVLIALVVIGIAVGVGVGVGLNSAHHSQSGSATTTGSTPLPTTIGSTPLPTPTDQHGVFNDSSLASLETSERNRHVFFQDLNRTLRHALYSESQSTWSVNFTETNIVDARDHTPLASIKDDSGQIYLFYVQANGSLTSQQFKSGRWQPYPLLASNNQDPVVPPATSTLRSLSVITVPAMSDSSGDLAVFILSQQPDAGASLFYASTDHRSGAAWAWRDITSTMTSSNRSFHFNAPFAAAPSVNSVLPIDYLQTDETYPWVAIFSNQDDNPDSNMVGASYDGSSFQSASFGLSYDDLVPDHSQSLPSNVRSNTFDLQIIGIRSSLSILYVNEGQLSSTGEGDLNVGSVKVDTNPYPFTRLSSFLSVGGLFYLYHQLDASTIAEAVFDIEGGWTTSSINVPNS